MIYFENDPPKLLSPIWISVREVGDDGSPDCLYDQSAPYEQDVRRILHNLHSAEFSSTDLMTYFTLPDNREMEAVIRSKIRTAPLRLQAIGSTLYAIVEPELSAMLTEDELQTLVGQLEYQFQNGWGAEFEITSTVTSQGDREMVARPCPESINIYTAAEYLELRQTDNSGSQINMSF